jgi:inosose dehydratase
MRAGAFEDTSMQIISRRQILQSLSALTIGGATAPFLRALAASAPSGIRLGAQTNAWKIDPQDFNSFLDVLGQIKSIGYSGFETGFFNLVSQFDAPADARRKIAATGLDFTGIHIAIPFDKTDSATKLPPSSLYERVAHGGVALGAQRMIFSGAPAANEEELKRKIEGLNAAGSFARGLGLQFLYHNHWWEVQSKVGELDTLYAQTNPADVSFLLDAGHAYRGGADVPGFLRQHAARIKALHLRDYKDGKQVPLGEGTFPLTQVAATLRELQWQGWAINEEERESGVKLGASVIEPAYHALRGAFPA